MTLTTQSADGTTIAYEKTGTGPALIVIGGAFNTRQSAADLVPLLATHFSVYAYDRRARGDSTNTHPYATEREVDDLAALIDAVGGSAMVYGHSSGGIVGLHGAARGLAITKLAIYEPPFTQPIGFESVGAWKDAMQTALDVGDSDAAAVLFLQGSGAPPGMIEGITSSPWWPGMTAIAHTLPYDLSFLNDGEVPIELLGKVAVPTLVMFGDDSPPWAGRVASTAADALPDGTTRSFTGQDHNVDSAVIAPQLIDFFTGAGGR